jgi:phage terminase large subunit GpA-like protein
VFSVVVGIAKLEFYNNLRKAADVLDDGVTLLYPVGFVHLPKVDGEFVQQLCAEQLMTRRNRHGFAVREWHKMRERNEALDCYVYARAAASATGLDRFEERHWLELERQLGVPDGKPPPTIPTANANTAVLPAEPQTEATHRGGLAFSGTNPTGRRVIRSRWIT